MLYNLNHRIISLYQRKKTLKAGRISPRLSSGSFVDWTPILEIYGENYDGVTLTPNVGGTTTKTGTPASGSSGSINSKAVIITFLNEWFVLDTFDNNSADNYVCFWVSTSDGTEGTAIAQIAADFFDDIGSNCLLGLFTRQNVVINPNQTYAYREGNGAPCNIEQVDNTGFNVINNFTLKVLLLENLQGKLYVQGNLVHTGTWTPNAIGTSQNSRNRLFFNTSGVQESIHAHLSIFKFPAASQVKRISINNYANALVTFYGSQLVWNNI